MFRVLLLSLFLSVPGPALADVVEQSLQKADDLWGRTVDYAGAALAGAQRVWRERHPEDARLWDDLIPRLDEVVVLRERRQGLPEAAWFGDDQASIGETIDELLDEVAVILVGDNALRQRRRELDGAMAENRAAITELKQRRLTAPSDSLWRQTVDEIVAEIGRREGVLVEQQQAMAALHAETAATLRAKGVEIDADGVEFLLATVVGDEVMDMTLAFEKVRDLIGQLETLTVDSGEDLATARRYYGMYTVLLEALDRMHGTLLERIGVDYRPRIQVIAERARALRRETRELAEGGLSGVLQANLEAQQLTIDAAGRYAAYLERQQQQVLDSRRRLSRDLAIARNTYETVKMSGDLVTLMQDSRHLLDSLFRLQMPPLRAFENLEMKREFRRLTSTLRDEAA